MPVLRISARVLQPFHETEPGNRYLDGQVVLDLVQRPRRREAADGVVRELLLPPRHDPVAVPQVLGREHQPQVREVAGLGHLDADGLRRLGQRLDLAARLVALVVVDDLLVDAHRDLLDRHLARLGQPVRVGRELDVDADGVERAVRPARQRDAQRHQVVPHALGRLGPVVHAEGGQRVVAGDGHGEGVLALVLVTLLHRHHQLVVRLGGAARQLQAGRRHAPRHLLAAAAVGDEDDEGQVHGQHALALPAGRAAEEQHLLADDVGDLLARGGQVLLRDRVGGRVDRLAALEGDGDERDEHGRADAHERPDLDLAFYPRLCTRGVV